MVLKSGERRRFNPMCPFDCTRWDECVCENTAIRDGHPGGKYFFTADEVTDIQDRAIRDV